MLNYILKNAKDNYENLKSIIENSKTKNEVINKLRQEDVIIEEFNNIINIKKDELKIVVNTTDNIKIEKILVYDENYEQYIDLF